MELKGVVFDLDHTLFDRYGTIMALRNHIFDNLRDYISPGITPEIFADSLCQSDKALILYGWESIFEDLCRKNMFSKVPDFEIYRSAIVSGFISTAVPYPFTYSVLESIRNKGLKIGIVTNGEEWIQKPKLDMLRLEQYTDAIVISGSLGTQKPAPEPFLKAAELLGEAPQNLLYVGDHPVNDVEGSRNAGYIPVWVKTYGLWHDNVKHADYEIGSIAELPSLIESLL